jgi:hypothetical protein
MTIPATGATFTLAALENAIARVEQLHPTKAQFTMMGRTSRHFRFKNLKLRGKKHTYRMLTAPATPSRRAKFETAVEGEFPIARQREYTEFSLSTADLTMFQATQAWNTKREIKQDDLDNSVTRLATMILQDISGSIGNDVNAQMFEPATAIMGTVTSIHDLDASGTTYSSGTGYASKFIRIDGPICRFKKNMILEIYDASTTTTLNVTVKVQDVIAGDDGPPIGGTRPDGLGHGIVCAPATASTGALNTGTTWGATALVADGDSIRMSGEYNATAQGFHGIPDFFDETVDCHNDVDGNAVDREAVGYSYLNPEVIIPASASEGSEVTFSIEDHFAQLEDTMPFIIDYGRSQRNIGDGFDGAERGIHVGQAMTFIAEPKIVNYVNRTYSQNTLQFTSTAAGSMDAARMKELFGVVGFQGIVYQSGSLPSIGFLADPNCKPYRGYLIEPDSFQFLVYGDDSPGNDSEVNLKWVDNGNGGRLHTIRGSGGGLTFYVESGAETSVALTCDQPLANVEFRHIKSDR